jgi:hypothetical protein
LVTATGPAALTGPATLTGPAGLTDHTVKVSGCDPRDHGGRETRAWPHR